MWCVFLYIYRDRNIIINNADHLGCVDSSVVRNPLANRKAIIEAGEQGGYAIRLRHSNLRRVLRLMTRRLEKKKINERGARGGGDGCPNATDRQTATTTAVAVAARARRGGGRSFIIIRARGAPTHHLAIYAHTPVRKRAPIGTSTDLSLSLSLLVCVMLA